MITWEGKGLFECCKNNIDRLKLFLVDELRNNGDSFNKKISWPDGKNFAFTVFDDTDYSTLKNV